MLSQEKITELQQKIDSPQLSADGEHLTFASALVGASNIWSSDADGHNPLQLTSFGGEAVGSAHWSPDGKWIVFDRRPKDHAQIYIIDSEGRNMRAITEGDYENNVPTWSRDGKSIYFSSNRTGRMELWKQDLGSGVADQVTQHGGFSALESYDGKYLLLREVLQSRNLAHAANWRRRGANHRSARGVVLGALGHHRQRPLFFRYGCIAPARDQVLRLPNAPNNTSITDRRQAEVLDSGVSASRNGHTIYYAAEYANPTIMITENIQ